MNINKCPFCGGEVEAVKLYELSPYYKLACKNEQCNSSVYFHDICEDLDKTIERYNSRVTAIFNQTGNNNTQITNAGTLNIGGF